MARQAGSYRASGRPPSTDLSPRIASSLLGEPAAAGWKRRAARAPLLLSNQER